MLRSQLAFDVTSKNCVESAAGGAGFGLMTTPAGRLVNVTVKPLADVPAGHVVTPCCRPGMPHESWLVLKGSFCTDHGTEPGGIEMLPEVPESEKGKGVATVLKLAVLPPLVSVKASGPPICDSETSVSPAGRASV